MTPEQENAPTIKTAAEYGCPERIWLQHDLEGTGEPYTEPVGDEVTWCWHQISQYDTEYVRADLHDEAIRLAIRAAVAQERERCAKVCEELSANLLADKIAAAIRRGE